MMNWKFGLATPSRHGSHAVMASKPGQRSDSSVFDRALSSVLVSLIAAVPVAGLADDEAARFTEWYVGAGVSYTGIIAGSFGGLSNGNDDTNSDVGMVVTAGYRFGQYTAAEIGYLDAGAPRFSSTRGFLCVEPDLCTVGVEQETTALTIAGVGILPVGQVWHLYAKAGAAFWDAVANQTFASPSGSVSADERADLAGTGLLIGFGAGAALANRVGLRIDYEWFDTDDALLAVDRAAGLQQFALEIHWRF